MSSIEIWFDGGGRYGFGNVRRSRELGEMLRRRGHAVRFVPRSVEAAALLGCEPGKEHPPTLGFLDLPYAAEAAVLEARRRGMAVVALDFDGTEPPDLVVSLQNVRRVPPGCRFLCGPQYAI